MAGTVTINILGDANDLQRALSQAQGSLDQFQAKARSIGDTATSIGRSMTIGLTLPLVAAFKVAFDELSQGAAVAAQTEAVIRSTGGAANVSAKQVDELASSLLRKTGIDDELIASGANVILTFRNIKNEAGAGNDVFTRATTAALDLSVALGKDMTSSAIMVGKALNDPIAGLTSLGRAGVQFTDSQKDTIRALVETGDVIGAQKIILKELETQVGGSARAYGETFAGQLSKAKEELTNSMAAILTTAIPVMQQLADWAVAAADMFESLPDPIKEVAVVIGAVVAAAGPLVYVFGAVSKAISGIIGAAQFLGNAFVGVERAVVNAVTSVQGMTAAQLALGGAMTLGLGALAAFVGWLAFSEGPYERAKQAAEEWGRKTVLAARSTGDELGALRAKQAQLTGTIDQLSAKQRDLSNAITEGQPGAQSYRGELENVSRALQDAQFKHEALKPRIAELKQQMLEAKAAEEARNAELRKVAAGTQEIASASRDAVNAIRDLSSAQLGAAGGALALEQANLNLEKAQRDYDAAIRDHGPLSDEARQADINLRQARLDVQSATDRARDSQDDLLATVRDSPAAIDALIAKTRDEIATYGDAQGVLAERIYKLLEMKLAIEGIPTSHGTKITIDGIETAIADLNYTKQTLNDITSREYRVMVSFHGDALGYLTASDRNIKRDIHVIPWS